LRRWGSPSGPQYRYCLLGGGLQPSHLGGQFASFVDSLATLSEKTNRDAAESQLAESLANRKEAAIAAGLPIPTTVDEDDIIAAIQFFDASPNRAEGTPVAKVVEGLSPAASASLHVAAATTQSTVKASVTWPPAVGTPVVGTLVAETPVVEPPVFEPPVVETPVFKTPVDEAPAVEPPSVVSPAVKPAAIVTPHSEVTATTPVANITPDESTSIDKGKGKEVLDPPPTTSRPRLVPVVEIPPSPASSRFLQTPSRAGVDDSAMAAAENMVVDRCYVEILTPAPTKRERSDSEQ
jgi:hypothetical protein